MVLNFCGRSRPGCGWRFNGVKVVCPAYEWHSHYLDGMDRVKSFDRGFWWVIFKNQDFLPVNENMVGRAPHPGPLPIGSADSADAEREKRSQRLEAGTRRVVEGFAGAGFRWRGLTSAATESSLNNSLPGGLDGIGPASDELVRVRVNDPFGAGMGRFFDRVGAGFYRLNQISIADKPGAGSLISIGAVRMAER
jgi:hypothetical protein